MVSIFLVSIRKSECGTVQPTKSCLPPKVFFHRRLSSTEGRLPPKIAFHQRSSFTKGCLSLKDVFHRRSSSNKGRLPPKVIFHQISSSIEGHFPLKGVFHRRLSSPEGCVCMKQTYIRTKPDIEAACCLKIRGSLQNRCSPLFKDNNCSAWILALADLELNQLLYDCFNNTSRSLQREVDFKPTNIIRIPA